MREEQLNAIISACKAIKNGRYEVREGLIPWQEFPFDVYPFGLSIEIVEEDDAAEPAVVSEVHLTLMTRMPDQTKRSVNNRVLNEMRQDTRDIWQILTEAVSSDGQNTMFLSVERLPTITYGDTNRKLQGIGRTLILEY